MQGVVLYPPAFDDNSSSSSTGSSRRDGSSVNFEGIYNKSDIENTNGGWNKSNTDESSSVASHFLNNPRIDRQEDTKRKKPSSSSDVMSDKLSENFEILKRAKKENSPTKSNNENDAGADDARPNIEEYRELAAETARLANEEIQRMQRAVAELEALVQERGNDGMNQHIGAAIGADAENHQQQFPSLPKVVMVVSNDAGIPFEDDDEIRNDNGEEEDDEDARQDDDNQEGHGDDGSVVNENDLEGKVPPVVIPSES